MTHTVPREVQQWLEAVQRHSLSRNTRRAYASDRAYFQAWHVARFGVEAVLPINEAVLVTFVADSVATLPPALDHVLQQQGHKAHAGAHALSTVTRRLVSLHVWHVEAGVTSACRTDTVKQLLRRSQRTVHRREPHRSRPITLAILRQLLTTCDDTARGDRDRALLLVGWCCGGRRRSELAALDVADLHADDSVLQIRHSKTDQGGEGFQVPIPRPAHAALQQWRSHLTAPGALFRSIHRGGALGARLEAGGINRLLKRRVAEAGLDPTGYSAHGLRSGFITECERQRMPLPAVMAMTGHRSVDVAVGYVAGTASTHNPILTLLNQWPV